MKKIEAVIQPFRFEQVRAALDREGLEAMTVTEVVGHGRQRGHAMVYRGAEYDADFRHKTRVEIVVHDLDVERAIAAILAGARAGQIGDGKIFVSDVSEVVRIRNDQRNEAAL